MNQQESAERLCVLLDIPERAAAGWAPAAALPPEVTFHHAGAVAGIALTVRGRRRRSR